MSKRALMMVLAACTAAGALAGSAGCAGPEEPQILRVWPDPPAAPRIYLRKVVSSRADYKRPGLFDGLIKLVAGEQKQQIQRPQGVAFDGEKLLYVVDQELQGVHVFDTHSGKTRFIEQAGEVYFVSPVGAAFADGLLAVSDNGLKKVFLFDDDDDLVATLDTPEGLQRPTGVAFAPGGLELFVVDTIAGEVCVFARSGKLLRRFGRLGQREGELNGPTYIHVDAEGRVYVSDSLNFRVQVFTPEGKVEAIIGSHGDATGHLALPKGIGVDEFGHIYIADSAAATLQIYDRAGRFLLALGTRGDGPGQFQVPSGVFASGNMIYVCDFYRGNVQIFEYIGGEEPSANGNQLPDIEVPDETSD